MGVIMESLEGDPIVLITNFLACEQGTLFSWEKSREFNIGDIVYFVDDFKDENETQDYLAYCVLFKTEDGKIYSATQTYFVTLEDWNKIKSYFKEKLGS